MKYSFENSLGNISRMISKALGETLERKLIENNIFITAEQWSLISLLFQKGDLSQRDIGVFLGFNKVRILRIINRLEVDHIIVRMVNVNDKRFRIIRLTDLGKDYYNKIIPFAQETIEVAFNKFSEKETAVFNKLFKKIYGNLS